MGEQVTGFIFGRTKGAHEMVKIEALILIIEWDREMVLYRKLQHLWLNYFAN